MFGFEPMVAAFNIIELLRPLLIVVGIVAILMLLFKGQIGMTILTLFVVAFLYYSFDPAIMQNIGKSTIEVLTISEPLNPATPTQTEEPPETPQQPTADEPTIIAP